MSLRSRTIHLLAAGALASIGLSQAARADQWAFVGSRYQAMGGTGVAFATDSLATHWNPANLAWRKGYDVQLPVTLNAAVENRALEKVSNLVQQYDGLESVFEDKILCSSGPCSSLSNAERRDVMDFLTDLGSYGKGGENVHFNLSLGLAGGDGPWAVSAMSLTTGTIVANVDLDNLGITPLADDFLGAGIPTAPSDLALRDELSLLIGGASSVEQANLLVALAEGSGASLSDPGTRSLLRGIAGGFGTTSASPNSFANNQTGAVMGGLSTQEFGLSYGLKLPVPFLHKMGRRTKRIFRPLHYRFAVGGTIKYIAGVTFTKTHRYDTAQSGGDILTGLTDFDRTQWTHTAGLDLAVSAKPFEFLKIGMVAKYINSPKFAWGPVLIGGQWVDEIVLEPQVRMGLALTPIKNFIIAFDFDATENSMSTLPDFKSRILSIGGEYTIPATRMFDFALRMGGYTNVASGSGGHPLFSNGFSDVSDIVSGEWALTGGLGVRAWNFALDASAGASLQNERIRTDQYEYVTVPTRMNVGLTLKWIKSI